MDRFYNPVLKRRKITGIGNALVDLLIHESEDFVRASEAAKGGMTYFSNDAIEKVVRKASNPPEVVPGGAVCNTMIGLGRLGNPARFIGKRGLDDRGRFFEEDLRKKGVEPVLFSSESPTGRVLSIITPDAQRTMMTFLGAASELSAQEISPDLFSDSAVAVVEGYLLFNRELILEALRAARQAGALISLDLASFTVVDSAGSFLKEIVEEYVDILMANEDEARAFTGCQSEEEALQALACKADIAVLKKGSKGSSIWHGGEVYKIEPFGTRGIVDTTGAGDLWAAGFLYGLVNEYSIAHSGNIGSACGFEVCRVDGADIPEEGWGRIRQLLK
jgi:sugar/nucleoside kinase (ribokinase family)